MKLGNIFAGFGILVLTSIFLTCCGPKNEGKPSVKPVIEQPKTEQVKPQEQTAIKLEEQKPAATAEQKKYKIALKPLQGDTTKYKLVTESIQSVEWSGQDVNNAEIKNGRNYTRVEMTFDQKVNEVKENGNVEYQITFDSLKFIFKLDEQPVQDFDSSRDTKSVLATLIGQSYIIEKDPNGAVVRVDADQARNPFIGSQNTDNTTGMKLLDPEAIKNRHGAVRMPAKDKNELMIGQNWSGIETFTFGLMGSKSYEKIFTLKEVTNDKAIVTMEAIPSSEKAGEMFQKQDTDISGMFESSDVYNGQLILNLKDGKVEKYNEKLNVKWTVIDKTTAKSGSPVAMTMGAQRSINLEKLD